MIKEILKVNSKLNLATCIWGSSGYGKTSLSLQYADENKMDLILIEGISINPSLTAIPVITDKEVETRLTTWLHKVCSATKPTLLLIDELNRVEHPTVFSMLTSIILQRQFMLHKIPDCVQIVATCNYESEDSNVREIHDALYKRLCHVEHSPDVKELVIHMEGVCEEIQEALIRNEILDLATHDFFEEEVISKLNANGRQVNFAIKFFLAAKDVISEAAIKTGMRGIIGSKSFKLFDTLSNTTVDIIPNFEDNGMLNKIRKIYSRGKGLELIETFKLRAEKDPKTVAEVALLTDIPEIISAMVTVVGSQPIRSIVYRDGELFSFNPTQRTDDSFKVVKATKKNVQDLKSEHDGLTGNKINEVSYVVIAKCKLDTEVD
jgi:hypothetical protein